MSNISEHVELYFPNLMAVVYGWILLCSTFRRQLCAASSGAVSLAVKWTVCLKGPRLFSWRCRTQMTAKRREFSHRTRPSSPDNRAIIYTSGENLSQIITNHLDWLLWNNIVKPMHFRRLDLTLLRIEVKVWSIFHFYIPWAGHIAYL